MDKRQEELMFLNKRLLVELSNLTKNSPEHIILKSAIKEIEGLINWDIVIKYW